MAISNALRGTLRLSVLMLLSAALGTASASTALAVPRAHPAAPWTKAGPGWAVVQYSTGTSVIGKPERDKPGRETLYLVSPQGTKYPFYSWKPARTGATPFVIDWSGDRQRVLLKSQVTYSAPVELEQVSLATGKVIGKFSLPPDVRPIGYTKPDGLNLLAIGEGGQLIRFDLNGHRQKVLGQADKHFGDALYTPDGTEVIAASSHGLEGVSNAGGIVRHWTAPRSIAECDPVRWWAAGTVLARCFPKREASWRLWLFNLADGRVKPLTSASTSVPQEDGWQVHGRLYLNVVTGCQAIDQVGPGDLVRPLPVPGDAGALVVAPAGARLVVLGQRNCNAGESLFWFDPVHRSIKYLFHATGATVGVVEVAPFGQR